jgi:molybdenum cofactor cytidylyltransferase
MGGPNKLLQPVGGIPMVAHAVVTALAAGAAPVVVVTGGDPERVAAALDGRPVEWAPNPRWRDGMSTSVAAGVAALDGRVDGALLCLGDMPRVTDDDLRALTRAFRADRSGALAWIPTHGGRRGNPVLWAAEAFPRLQRLRGDRGASALFGTLHDRIVEIAAGEGVLVDADTPEALERLRAPEGGGLPA